jgi:hypothetical protein
MRVEMSDKPMIYIGREFVNKIFDWYKQQGFCNQTAYDSVNETVYFQSQHKHNNLVDNINQALWSEGAFKELEALKKRLIEEAQDYLADNAMVGKFHPDAMRLNKQLFPDKYPDFCPPNVHLDGTRKPKKWNGLL